MSNDIIIEMRESDDIIIEMGDPEPIIVEVESIATIGDAVVSTPLSGQYRIIGIRLDADKKIVITYDETPEA